MSEFTTIALHDEDKERLDAIKRTHLDENASYREVINFLADEVEEQAQEYDRVLAKAIIRASDDDLRRVRTRVENDAEFVESLAEEMDSAEEAE